MPGAAPQAPAPGGGFVLVIPPDPNWSPIEQTDNLEMDGYYMAKIVKEEARTDASKSAGVFMYFEIQDPDALGRKLSKFMPDPTSSKGNTWFLWRGLIASITGALDNARAGLTYQPGMLIGQTVYLKTEAYLDDGQPRTGIGPYVMAKEYGEAKAAGGTKFRWPAKPRQPNAGVGQAGALPGGVPSFPGLGVGLPGAPTTAAIPVPAQQTVAPAPMVAAPMQPVPAMAPPPPAPQFQQPQPPQQMLQPAAPVFVPGQMPPPGSAAPWQPAPQPATPPPANGAPQPTGAPPFAFPPPRVA